MCRLHNDVACACRWGCFETIQIDRPGWARWLLRNSVRLRTRWLLLPYGDQGIFVQQKLMRLVHDPYLFSTSFTQGLPGVTWREMMQ